MVLLLATNGVDLHWPDCHVRIRLLQPLSACVAPCTPPPASSSPSLSLFVSKNNLPALPFCSPTRIPFVKPPIYIHSTGAALFPSRNLSGAALSICSHHVDTLPPPFYFCSVCLNSNLGKDLGHALSVPNGPGRPGRSKACPGLWEFSRAWPGPSL